MRLRQGFDLSTGAFAVPPETDQFTYLLDGEAQVARAPDEVKGMDLAPGAADGSA